MRVQRKSSKRKQYTPEFKREALRLVTEGGLSMSQMARDLGLTDSGSPDNLVSRWKKEEVHRERYLTREQAKASCSSTLKFSTTEDEDILHWAT